MSRKSLGKFVKYKREELGLNKLEFYEKYHIAEGTMTNLEGGHSNFSSGQLLQFGKIFGIRPGILADLLGDAVTFDQAIILGRQLNVSVTNEGGFIIELPKTFTSDNIKDVQKYIDFIEFQKQSQLTGPGGTDEAVHADLARKRKIVPNKKQLKQIKDAQEHSINELSNGS